MNRGLALFKPGTLEKHLLSKSDKKAQLKIAQKNGEKFYLVGKIEKCVSRNNVGYVNYLRINHPGEHWHGFVMEKRKDTKGLLFRFVSSAFSFFLES